MAAIIEAEEGIDIFHEAYAEFKNMLEKYTIADIIAAGYEDLPPLDWNEITAKKRNTKQEMQFFNCI